ncbi:MAG: hypothetical protein V3Q69_10675 [Burkholderia sp.]
MLLKSTRFIFTGRYCINRARSVDVYAQRAQGPALYQVRFQSNCLIFQKNAQGRTQDR